MGVGEDVRYVGAVDRERDALDDAGEEDDAPGERYYGESAAVEYSHVTRRRRHRAPRSWGEAGEKVEPEVRRMLLDCWVRDRLEGENTAIMLRWMASIRIRRKEQALDNEANEEG